MTPSDPELGEKTPMNNTTSSGGNAEDTNHTPSNAVDIQIPSTSSANGTGAEEGSGQQTKGYTPKKQSKGSVQIMDPPVTETRGYSGGYTIVKVEEKHGALYRAIPVMPLPLAVLFCLLNIGVPGFGTLLSSFTVFCCGSTRISRPIQAFGLNLVSALLQMLTFIVIVGWIWSILWGMTMVQMSLSIRNAKSMPYYVRRQSSLE